MTEAVAGLVDAVNAGRPGALFVVGEAGLGEDFLPVVAGFATFGIVTGLAVVVSRAPARWMGWVLVAFGVAAAVPPIVFFAFLATFLCALVAGIWLAVQAKPRVPADQPEPSLTAA